MTIVYRLQDLEFEWDEVKSAANLQKHGVSFEEAAEVFFDPFYQSGETLDEDAEPREFTIGYSLSQRIVLTIFTHRLDRLRIISARPATRAERKLYEEA